MKIRVKGWITCTDYEKLEKEVTALGTSNGDVQIVTTSENIDIISSR